MNSDRTVLTDAMWARVEYMLPRKATDPGVTAAVSRSRPLADPDGIALAQPAGVLRQLEQRLQALPPLGALRRL